MLNRLINFKASDHPNPVFNLLWFAKFFKFLGSKRMIGTETSPFEMKYIIAIHI